MRSVDADNALAHIRRGRLLAILIVTTGIGPLAMNMPLPSLPGLAREFAVGYEVVQFVLTGYLIALALAQLAYGTLSDRFGRRPVMMAGLGIFLAGSLVCAFAGSLETLLAGRAIQGAGGCVGLVIGRAVLRDLYGRERSASLLGYVMMTMVIAPMISPALGGALDETIGWRAGFVLVATVTVACIAFVVLQLPETHLERSTGGIAPLLRAFGALLRIRLFVLYSAIIAGTTAMFFGFLAGAPYIVIELMGRRPGEFGLWSMMIAGGYMIGNFASGRYAERVGTRRLIMVGTLVGVGGAGLLLMSVCALPLTPLALFAPMMVITFANGLVMPSAVASSVSIKPEIAGAGSGLSGFLQVSAGAAVTVLMGFLQGSSALPMALTVAAAALVPLVAFLLVARQPDPGGT